MNILDSSYILHSNLDFSDSDYCLTNSVLEEIKSDEARLVIISGIKNGNVKVMDPSPNSIKKVKKVAGETGDLTVLSSADLDILALALERGFTLFTDDYAVQNVASTLKLPWEGLQQPGIKKKLIWSKICPVCGKKYKTGEICPICGTKLIRKVSQTL